VTSFSHKKSDAHRSQKALSMMFSIFARTCLELTGSLLSPQINGYRRSVISESPPSQETL